MTIRQIRFVAAATILIGLIASSARGQINVSGVGIGSGQVVGGGNLNLPMMQNPASNNPYQHFRQVYLTGRVPADEQHLPAEAKIIHARLEGQTFAMRLDTETNTGDLSFDVRDDYARELYQAIQTRRVEVVGDAVLRRRLLEAVARNLAIRIEAYVFDPASPYLVLISVGEIR